MNIDHKCRWHLMDAYFHWPSNVDDSCTWFFWVWLGWWAVVTITTVGYGDYYPVTSVGRIIAVVVMFSGIGIVVAFLGMVSQRRLRRVESRFESKTEVQTRSLGDETKTAIKNKIEGIEKLTEEDFDTLIVMIKSLRRTLLEESKISYRCSRCGNPYHSKPKFCSSCGLDLT